MQLHFLVRPCTRFHFGRVWICSLGFLRSHVRVSRWPILEMHPQYVVISTGIHSDRRTSKRVPLCTASLVERVLSAMGVRVVKQRAVLSGQTQSTADKSARCCGRFQGPSRDSRLTTKSPAVTPIQESGLWNCLCRLSWHSNHATDRMLSPAVLSKIAMPFATS
jgi:hypothetical protein